MPASKASVGCQHDARLTGRASARFLNKRKTSYASFPDTFLVLVSPIFILNSRDAKLPDAF